VAFGPFCRNHAYRISIQPLVNWQPPPAQAAAMPGAGPVAIASGNLAGAATSTIR
jgi:hypothetical protein